MGTSHEIISALNSFDYEAARRVKLREWKEEVGRRTSWKSPQYAGLISLQESITLREDRDDLLDFFALETTYDRYVLRDANDVRCETPQQFFARVACGVAMGPHTPEEMNNDVNLFEDARVFAQELYDILSQKHALFATPILTNAGTSRGQMISCFVSAAGDSIENIFGTLLSENATLAKGGGGVGNYMGHIREGGAGISQGGVASGPVPFTKNVDSGVLSVNQSGTARRGSAAAYCPVWHPDIEQFADIRKPKGDVNLQCLNLHHGVCVDDKFMQAVENRQSYALRSPKTGKVVKNIDAYKLAKKLWTNRVETGEPYILHLDTVNRNQPEVNQRLGFRVETSNLCIEIMEITSFLSRVVPQKFLDYLVGRPTPSGRTAVCDLGSLNYATFDQWKGHGARNAYLMLKGLDNVLSHFIRHSGRGYERAVHASTRGRDVGLGVMGWFDYLQAQGIPFETIHARSLNRIRFREFGEWTALANKTLAAERGPAPDAILASSFTARMVMPVLMALGLANTKIFRKALAKLMPTTGIRNVNNTAIAPTASIGIIAGSSPSIEPPAANSFKQKTLSGRYIVRNKHLQKVLSSAYPEYDNDATWASIHRVGGSVQHLDWMAKDHRDVFKTAFELNQREVVQQAADRQPYITQSQSLNVFFAPGANKKISAKYLYDVHMLAWKAGVKSLYYCRSEATSDAADVSANAEQNQRDMLLVQQQREVIAYEECAVCQ